MVVILLISVRLCGNVCCSCSSILMLVKLRLGLCAINFLDVVPRRCVVYEEFLCVIVMFGYQKTKNVGR